MVVETKKGSYTYNGVEYEFEYKTNLKASEKIDFVNLVVNSLVEDGYFSILRNMLFDFELIRAFTNIDVSEIANSVNAIDKIEYFLENTNIVEVIKANISISLIIELNNCVDDNIQYRTGIKVKTIENALVSILEVLEEKVKKVNVKDLMNDYFKSDDYKKHLAELQNKPDINFADNILRVVKAAKE